MTYTLKGVDKLPTRPGIYLILCLANGRGYVGKGKSMQDRGQDHDRKLVNGKHYNTSESERYFDYSDKKWKHYRHADDWTGLLEDWKKYGPDAFVIYVLEECSWKITGDREHYWVHKLKTMYYDGGYNLCEPLLGGSYIMSDISKARLSASLKASEKHQAAMKRQFAEQEELGWPNLNKALEVNRSRGFKGLEIGRTREREAGWPTLKKKSSRSQCGAENRQAEPPSKAVRSSRYCYRSRDS